MLVVGAIKNRFNRVFRLNRGDSDTHSHFKSDRLTIELGGVDYFSQPGCHRICGNRRSSGEEYDKAVISGAGKEISSPYVPLEFFCNNLKNLSVSRRAVRIITQKNTLNLDKNKRKALKGTRPVLHLFVESFDNSRTIKHAFVHPIMRPAPV
jgi:hypothetical protein